RLTYRLAVQKPIPRWLLPLAKVGSAALIGLLVFFLIPLGGGPGGWGYGPGLGGGPGKGPGAGGKDTGIVAQDGGKKRDDAKPTPDKEKVKPGDKDAVVSKKTSVEIEVLGGQRYL